jgi:hypothetical protein
MWIDECGRVKHIYRLFFWRLPDVDLDKIHEYMRAQYEAATTDGLSSSLLISLCDSVSDGLLNKTSACLLLPLGL